MNRKCCVCVCVCVVVLIKRWMALGGLEGQRGNTKLDPYPDRWLCAACGCPENYTAKKLISSLK